MKLLIVDDEAKIRKGITKGIDWKSLGIEEVLNAEDGLEAFDIYILKREIW